MADGVGVGVGVDVDVDVGVNVDVGVGVGVGVPGCQGFSRHSTMATTAMESTAAMAA